MEQRTDLYNLPDREIAAITTLCANQIGRTIPVTEEVIQDVRIKLWEIEPLYDENKGANFLTYAIKCIKTLLYSYWRISWSEKRYNKMVRLNRNDSMPESHHIPIESDVSPPDTKTIHAEEFQAVYNAMQELSEEDRLFLVRRFFDGKTVYDLMKPYQKTHPFSIQFIERRILARIRRILRGRFQSA